MDIDLNIETDEEMDIVLETPRKAKMRRKITGPQAVAKRRLNLIRNLKQKQANA